METKSIYQKLKKLGESLAGDMFTDKTTRILYSTDASAYREMPLAVAQPKNKDDIKKLIAFAAQENTSIIPRTAGTSLAGQVVGNGIVVDVSKYMNKIIELNAEEKWVRVEPGVILDDLNRYLADYGLFFGPETSTANRCMIGGMVGNNACGSHSLIYGSTRDHTLAINAILADGSEAEFGVLSKTAFEEKCRQNTLEGSVYQNIKKMLSDSENQESIRNGFPKESIPRRNHGYAIDLLLHSEPFSDTGEAFNFCKLLAGSEGTLAFSTEIKLNLVPVPPKQVAVVCAHFDKLDDAFHANLIALKYKPGAVEMMDKTVLDCTKGNIEQMKNRFFVKGDPKSMLMIEFARETKEEIETLAEKMEAEMREAGYGYHFPVLWDSDTKKVWDLRKAGLGLLSNVPGDKRSVTVIEDTAVSVEDLPQYMKEFGKILDKYQLNCVHYAHIGTGELHLRPMLNLKDEKDLKLFRTVLDKIAHLVKKYRGSLSGEHGDGRLRGEFIPFMLGERNYSLLKQVKAAWDSQNVMNPGKITDTPAMDTSLRYEPGQKTRNIQTVFDFSKTYGVLRAAERCNGSGDCRKSVGAGGTMCPSYMATRDEKNVTRARANMLREMLTRSEKDNPFDNKEIYEVMDLCLSCKACKSECPSSVDVAKLKAEFLQQYYDVHGIPLRSRLVAYISRINALGSIVPPVTNFFMGNKVISKFIMKSIGFSPERQMPLLYKTTLKRWTKKYIKRLKNEKCNNGKVYLFNDEFTNFNDTTIGIKAIQLLTRLGYEVIIPKHGDSGRTFLSKGLVRTAKKIANKNVNLLKNLVTEKTPLVGIEPSAILAFRDEYPELVDKQWQEAAEMLAKNSFMIDEFLVNEIEKGNISKDMFTKEKRKIKFHGHCQQKAVASTAPTKKLLSFPENYEAEEIPSGCCGMAGSFGFEKEHYDVSMKIGELVLFPAVRAASEDTIIAAPGTSCRHQIKDGTQREAKHPVEVLYDALV